MKELSRQEKIQDTHDINQMADRIKSEQRDRKRIQTGKTIFVDEAGQHQEKQMVIERNASENERMSYKKHFRNLQIFLQFYKEKLMLTKKVQDSLSKHVVTMDALKKIKEGYTDQF